MSTWDLSNFPKIISYLQVKFKQIDSENWLIEENCGFINNVLMENYKKKTGWPRELRTHKQLIQKVQRIFFCLVFYIIFTDFVVYFSHVSRLTLN